MLSYVIINLCKSSNMKGAEPMLRVKETDFMCQRCGKCCKHRGDLHLTPIDVFQISKFLGITCEEMVRKYTRLSHMHNFPQIALDVVGSQDVCIFYKRQECLIYPARPAHCYTFPFVICKDSEETQSFGAQLCYSRVKRQERILVKQYIQDSSERYEAEKELFRYVVDMLNIIDSICQDMNKCDLDQVKKLIYCDYNTEEEMEPQIRRNMEEIFCRFALS